jgi:integrase
MHVRRNGIHVPLQGIHKVTTKGHTYYYAWRGGPRILAPFGSPGFLEEYQTAHASRRQPAQNCLFTLVAEFRQSAEFSTLSEVSRKGYKPYLKLIEERFGTMPLKLVERPQAREVFLEHRDKFRDTPRKADYFWSTLRRVLSFGKNRGKITVNVCERGGKLYKAERQEKIWTAAQVEAFIAVGSPELSLALLMALWTGQRQGDLLRATWDWVDGDRLKLKQSKTGAYVVIPLSKVLIERLGATPRRSVRILTNSKGNPWTSDGFQTSWGKACKRAGVEGVTFHDLRGTAVTRFAKAGCTVPEIAAITGHSLKDAEAILEAHYLGGSEALARAAMEKLEARTDTVKPGVKP